MQDRRLFGVAQGVEGRYEFIGIAGIGGDGKDGGLRFCQSVFKPGRVGLPFRDKFGRQIGRNRINRFGVGDKLPFVAVVKSVNGVRPCFGRHGGQRFGVGLSRDGRQPFGRGFVAFKMPIVNLAAAHR